MRKVKKKTLNVGSMTKRSGEVVQFTRRKSLQLLCVQETTCKVSKTRRSVPDTNFTITGRVVRVMKSESEFVKYWQCYDHSIE